MSESRQPQIEVSSIEIALIWEALGRLGEATNDAVKKRECTELLAKMKAAEKQRVIR